jgi:hypothetical protein
VKLRDGTSERVIPEKHLKEFKISAILNVFVNHIYFSLRNL